jgi:hypothetical protein
MLASARWARSKRRLTKWALVGAAIGVISAASEAQVTNPQSQPIAIKADAAPLCALVGKNQVIVFRYNYDPARAEPRVLQPYAVGYTEARKILLFGRQVKGYSKSVENGTGELPGWRNFRTDKIKKRMVNVLNSDFDLISPDADEYHFVVEFICKNEAVP